MVSLEINKTTTPKIDNKNAIQRSQQSQRLSTAEAEIQSLPVSSSAVLPSTTKKSNGNDCNESQRELELSSSKLINKNNHHHNNHNHKESPVSSSISSTTSSSQSISQNNNNNNNLNINSILRSITKQKDSNCKKRLSFDLASSTNKESSSPKLSSKQIEANQTLSAKVKRSYSNIDRTYNPANKFKSFRLYQKKLINGETMSSSSFNNTVNTPQVTPAMASSSTNYSIFNESNHDMSLENPVNTNSESKRLQTYKDRRKNYRLEKKKLTDELISAIQDPTTIVMYDWLKVRTTLKQWNKYFCELRPGSLFLYKNQKTHKQSNWIGTVMLRVCELIERPSKKDGFCFKLFHPLDHPIWSPKGPHGEDYTSFMFPLPMSSVIFRAPSEEAGRKWMEAIELSLNCSNLMVPRHNRRDSIPLSPNNSNNNSVTVSNNVQDLNILASLDRSEDGLLNNHQSINDIDIEKHFDIDDENHTDHGEQDDSQDHHSTEESDDSIFEDDFAIGSDPEKPTAKHASSVSKKHLDSSTDVDETHYVFDGGNEEFGVVGDAGQTEEVPEENKSLLWTLLKQVRPGMDLSKVVLPTFILEPRSFLEKLTDYYYHCDILSKAALEDDPLMRMKLILKWYLSGFYKKPKGLKKPYNPILGETFRCYWHHPETDSKTFYIAEQVSHHPPISAFYVINRKDGYSISGSILAKSKFYGNSISAILEGTARLSLLARGEDYLITFPYAHCKGIFWGPLAFELGGKVTITCEKTSYKSELEFKLKPFFGSEDQCNLIVGKLRLGNETMGNIEGHWDSQISFKDKRTGDSELFWSGIDPKVKSQRLKRFVVPLQEQQDTESEKLWHKVTLAIQKQDQYTATVEKTTLEEAQRDAAKLRNSKMEAWNPKYFVLDQSVNDWLYRMAEMRPWDNRNDVKQYEKDYVIRTLERHLTRSLNYVRTTSQNEQVKQIPSETTKRRFRRQHTCADPTSIEPLSNAKMADGSNSLESQSSPAIAVSSNSGTNKYLTRNIENILQKLSTMQDSLDRVKEEQITLKTEFCNLRTTVQQTNQMTFKYLDGEVKPITTSTFSKRSYPLIITRMQMKLLIDSIPAEIRIVFIVLLAHLIFKYLF